MSNVIDNTTEAPLAEGLTKLIIEWQGKKVSFNTFAAQPRT